MNRSKARKLKDPTTLRVFFSSPFGGMEEEREELTRKYFPQFHHACNARGVQFVPVDMRWGITFEAADNAQVINICLREIDRSDIFIGFFGQRYGWHGKDDELLQKNFDNAVGRYPWLEQVRDKSVSELEFLHGHLNNPGAMPAAICFRDKAYDDSVRKKAMANGDKKGVSKYSSESERASGLLNDLIQRVKDVEHQCLGLKINYKNPHEGAQFMFQSVWDCCQELLSESDLTQLSPLEQNRLSHQAYMAPLISLYVGGERNLSKFSLESLKDHHFVLVRGPFGCGKSALIANIVKTLEGEKGRPHIIYHFVGCAPGTTDPLSILKRILDEVKSVNNTDIQKLDEDKPHGGLIDDTEEERSSEFYTLSNNLQNELDQASQNGKKLIILLDGLDKVTGSTKTAKHLFWFPANFPPGVSVIFSTVTSDTATYDLLVKERHYFDLEIEVLSQETQREISKQTLIKNGKELSPTQLERVVKAEQTQNPRFLKIVLSEISIYGYFRLLDKKIDSLIYSDGVKDLVNIVLQRLEEDYNVREHCGLLVQQVLTSLALSHEGLTESDLQDMFNIESQVWSPFYFAIDNFLISHAGLLRFAFSEFHAAVEERYLNCAQSRMMARNILIDYFEKCLQAVELVDGLLHVTAKKVANELPLLYKAKGDITNLIRILSDVRIFVALERKSVYELIDLWKATGLDQDEICDQLLHSFDLTISDVYDRQCQGLIKDESPPGYFLMPFLTSMKEMFSIAHHYRSHIKVLQRLLRIFDGIKGKISENTRQLHILNHRYSLACAFVDNSDFKTAEPIFHNIMAKCRSALETKKNEKVKELLAFACNGLGVLLIKQKRVEQAESLFLESKKLHQELGNKKCMVESIGNLGILKLNENQPDVALEYFKETMEAYKTIYFGHQPLQVGNLLTNIALCYRRLNRPEEASAMYFKSLEVKASAVGYDHEVIASCYLNLGSLEMISFQNYIKAEEYTRKALQILELNNVKLEQNEMWMTLENLVLILINLERHDEALPVFQRVFAMLARENKVELGFTSMHLKMMQYMLSKEMYSELADVAAVHASLPKLQTPNLFTIIDFCDKKAPMDVRPHRPMELTVEYALKELWPGDNALTAYVVKNSVLPSGNINLMLEMLQTMDEQNPDFTWTSYDVGATWCEMCENIEALVTVLEEGIKKYPDAKNLKTRLFDNYRSLKRFKDAYSLMQEILTDEENNQALMLVCGQVALEVNDHQKCIELWEKVISMKDEDQKFAEMAEAGLKSLREHLTEHETKEKENSQLNVDGHIAAEHGRAELEEGQILINEDSEQTTDQPTSDTTEHATYESMESEDEVVPGNYITGVPGNDRFFIPHQAMHVTHNHE